MSQETTVPFSEGRIDVALCLGHGCVARVDIRSTRPQLAGRIMAGRSPAEAVHLAGLVFSLCGQAQAAAARAACGAALGLEKVTVDERPVLMELAREHTWRLLLDWPQEAGHPPDMASLLALRRASSETFADTLEGLLREQLLGEELTVWLARDLAGQEAWRRQGATLVARLFGALDEGPDPGTSDVPLLHVLADWDADMATTLARRALDEPHFCARPDWQGEPAETGTLARLQAHPLLAAWIALRGRGMGARLLARLLELAALPQRLRDGGDHVVRAWAPGERIGVAGVETSRGLLFHVARLVDSRVADYRILAPTEWNFHPAGPLAQALTGLPVGGDLEARARLVARSLDPCVAFGLEIVDA